MLSFIYSLVVCCGVLALIYGALMVRSLLSASTGNERMQQIAAAIEAVTTPALPASPPSPAGLSKNSRFRRRLHAQYGRPPPQSSAEGPEPKK